MASKKNETKEAKGGLMNVMLAAAGGAAVGTLATHALNNFYSMLCLENGTFTSAYKMSKAHPRLLFEGLPETLVLRCASQGGGIAIQGYLNDVVGMGPFLSCCVGGAWDLFVRLWMSIILLRLLEQHIPSGKHLYMDAKYTHYFL